MPYFTHECEGDWPNTPSGTVPGSPKAGVSAGFSSGEPTELYALYLSRGLVSRAKQFREVTRKSVPFDMEIFFGRVDQNPSAYIR